MEEDGEERKKTHEHQRQQHSRHAVHAHTRVMWCSIKRSSFQLNHTFFRLLFHHLLSITRPCECGAFCVLSSQFRSKRTNRMGLVFACSWVFECTNMYRLSATLWQINKITANDTCWIYEVPFSLLNTTRVRGEASQQHFVERMSDLHTYLLHS